MGKEALEKLKDNPELAKSLEEAFRRKVGAEELLAAILERAGLDASVTEALTAEYQRVVGAAIAEEDVDEGTLTRVAGAEQQNRGVIDSRTFSSHASSWRAVSSLKSWNGARGANSYLTGLQIGDGGKFA